MNKLTKLTPEHINQLESDSGDYKPRAPILFKGDTKYMHLCDHNGDDIEHNVIDHEVNGGAWQEEWQLVGKDDEVLFTFRPNETFAHRPTKRYTPDNTWLEVTITEMIREVVRRAMEEQGAIFYYYNEEE